MTTQLPLYPPPDPAPLSTWERMGLWMMGEGEKPADEVPPVDVGEGK